MNKTYYVNDNFVLESWDTYSKILKQNAAYTIEEAVENKRKEINAKLDKQNIYIM